MLKTDTVLKCYNTNVKDKAVVPLLYEGRLARQKVNASPLDTFFEMVSEPMVIGDKP